MDTTQVVLGVFTSKDAAENLIRRLTSELGVTTAEISYVYRNPDGSKTSEVEKTNNGSSTATGAVVGGSIGALAGLATAAGVIPVIGPIFAAGPLLAALGLAGIVGTTAAGALTGVIAGSLVGALIDLGVSEHEAKEYEKRVEGGDILVGVQTKDPERVVTEFIEHGATNVRAYTPAP